MGFILCIACLATEVKIYRMNKSFIDSYANLTGITGLEGSESICFKCLALLKKFNEFRSNCLNAFEVLTSSQLSLDSITEHHIPPTHLQLTEPLVLSITPEVIDVDKSDAESSDNDKGAVEPYIQSEIEPDEIESDDKEFKLDKLNSDSDIDSNSKSVLKKFQSELVRSDIVSNINNVDTDNQVEENLHRPTQKRKLKTVTKTRNCKGTEKKQSVKSRRRKIKEVVTTEKQTTDSCLEKMNSDMVTVKKMSNEEAMQEVIVRKQTINYTNSKFKCDFCYRGFNVENAYKNHMRIHSTEYGNLDCDICHIKSTSRRYFRRHKLNSHTYKISCKVCDYVCFSLQQALLHIKLHEGKKYKCNYCDAEFNHSNTLVTHKRRQHSESLQLGVCALCGGVFHSRNGLGRHAVLAHKLEKNSKEGPVCAECDVHFSSETAYKRHLVLSSRHFTRNGCEMCGDTFPDETSLRQHKKIHSDLREHKKTHSDLLRGCEGVKPPLRAPKTLWPTQCRECPTLLASGIEYSQHMWSAHGQLPRRGRVPTRPRGDTAGARGDTPGGTPYVCEVCGKMFRYPALLKYHQTTHTGEKPYKCDECDKAFGNPAVLHSHRLRHRPKPAPAFKCDMCDRTFIKSGQLVKHQKNVHLKFRPYSCHLCGKSFPYPCDVKQHVRHAHGKVPWPKRDRRKRKVEDVEAGEWRGAVAEERAQQEEG